MLLPVLGSLAYMLGKRKGFSRSGSSARPGYHSRPGYYGILTAFWCLLPPFLIFGCWTAFSRPLHNTPVPGIVMLGVALLSATLLYSRIRPEMQARNHFELIVQLLLIACATIAIFTTLGIVLSVLFESIRFFQQIPLTDFLFGLKWSPQMALRADQTGSSGSFGALPVLAGTFLISGISLAIAVPVGLMSAIYLSEYAGPRVRN